MTEIQRATMLACECVELGRDPLLWRRRLAQGCITLIPDTVALVYEIAPPAAEPQNNGSSAARAELSPVLIDDGWTDNGRRDAFYAYLESGDTSDNPLLRAIMSHQQGVLETTAYEVAHPSQWRRLSVADYMTEAGVDFNCVTHAATRAGGRRDVMTIHRHKNAPRWSKRDRALLAILFRTLAPHLGRALRPVGEPSIMDLPPRVVGILDGYLRGLSSKQVAAERELSVHTVNEYTKLIHRHFGVQSRGELLALLAGVSHRHQIDPLFRQTER